MKDYFVYMLFCFDGTYYVGMTNDIERRLGEHQSGIDEGCYTSSRRPVVLAYVQCFDDVWAAIANEKKLKGWSHAKKSALARGDWKMIQQIAKPKYRRPSTSSG